MRRLHSFGGGRVAWIALSIALAVAGLLAGCADSTPSTNSITNVPLTGYGGAAFGGKVMAGTQPMVGAVVQVYAAGTTGNGSAGIALLTKAVTTDSAGSFSVAGYACPAAASVIYVVATGGRAGGVGSANGAAALMTSPGACSTVSAGAVLTINEVTTVASAFAMGRFLQAGGNLGASSTNLSGLTLAAGTLANLVNLTTGAIPGGGFPSTGTAPVSKMGTLANAMNACLVGGSGSAACSQLLSASAPAGAAVPVTTLDALTNVAQHPALGISAIYAVSTTSHAYAELAAAPNDWAVFVTYRGAGMNDPSAVSIDSGGRVWVANYFGVASLFTNTGTPVFGTGVTGNGLGSSYGAAVDAKDNVWVTNEPNTTYASTSSVSVLSATGAAITASPYASGGLYYPVGISFDTTGVAWVANYGNSRVILLDGNGNALSGATGFDGVDKSGNGNYFFPVAVAVDSKRNGWVANQSSNTITKTAPDGSSYTSYPCCIGASGVAIDASDNVWVANYYGDSVGLVSAAGSIVSGAGYTAPSLQHPQGIAVDGSGGVWVASFRGPGLTQLAGVGPGSGTVLSPGAGWAPEAAPVEAYGLAIDASGNVWVTGFGSNTLTEYVGMAVPVKTQLLGPVRVP